MAYNGAPSFWIPSWAEDATDITVPIASLSGLTAVEADGATGDIRNVVLSFLETIVAKYSSLATADRPTKMTATKNVSYNSTTGLYTHTYTLTFVCEPTDINVVAEV